MAVRHRKNTVGEIFVSDARSPNVNFHGARVRFVKYIEHPNSRNPLVQVEHVESGPYWRAGGKMIIHETEFRPRAKTARHRV